MQKLRDAMEGFLKEKASARQAVLSDTELAKDSAALLQTLQDLESNFAAKYVSNDMQGTTDARLCADDLCVRNRTEDIERSINQALEAGHMSAQVELRESQLTEINAAVRLYSNPEAVEQLNQMAAKHQEDIEEYK